MSEQCWSCNYKTELREFPNHAHDPENPDSSPVFKYCDLCANTLASNAHQYPTHYPPGVLETICYIGNAILAERRKENDGG